MQLQSPALSLTKVVNHVAFCKVYETSTDGSRGVHGVDYTCFGYSRPDWARTL